MYQQSFCSVGGNMKKHTAGNVLFILASVGIIWLLFTYFKDKGADAKEVPEYAFAVSVVASIIASLVYSYLQDQFLSTKQDKQFETLENTTNALSNTLQNTTQKLSMALNDTTKSLSETLNNTTNILSDMQTKEILRLKKRNEYNDEFWGNFIKAANSNLVLSGKTLYKWIEHSDLKEVFKSTIIKKLNEGCDITFIMYKLESLDGNDREERKVFKQFMFDSIFPLIFNNGNKPKLKIKETTILPYFYITNDIESLAMPYFATVSNEGNLTYGMKSGCGLDKSYSTDYRHIINTAEECKWIDEYLNGKDPKSEFN